jgi:hypothetical protein
MPQRLHDVIDSDGQLTGHRHSQNSSIIAVSGLQIVVVVGVENAGISV